MKMNTKIDAWSDSLPVIEAMKQGVKYMALLKPRRLRYQFVVTSIKITVEATKHSSNGQIVFIMTVERGRVVDD